MSLFPNRLNGKTAVITGATSGIGKSIAKVLHGAGVQVLLTGRREHRLKELSKELSNSKFFAFDVSLRKDCESFFEEIKDLKIDILVNNAGLVLGLDKVDQGSLDDFETVLETNINGVLYMTHLLGKKFREQNAGHILNIGSIAGSETYAGGAVYNATKFAVKALTKATKKDFHGTKVRVSEIAPGLVETEFSNVRFKGDLERAKKVYQGYQPLVADDVAEFAYYVLNLPEHVNILDSIIFPVDQSAATMVHKEL